MSALKLNQGISTTSFALPSNHAIIIKLSQIRGIGRVSKITKDGAYIKGFDADRSIFLTNSELAQRITA